MKIFQDIYEAISTLESLEGSAVCIGNFDGCHLGHQDLIRRVVKKARDNSLCSVILTFNPNPKTYFSGETEDLNLFTQAQKLSAFAELGVDYAIVQPFNEQFRKIDPAIFTRTLSHQLLCKFLFVGTNFRFGRDRSGDIKSLKMYSNMMTVEDIEIKALEGSHISSTRIRESLKDGQVQSASMLLGRPYCLIGTITQGKQVGRTIGFPTANLNKINQIIPKKGVYSGLIQLEQDTPELELNRNKAFPAIFNIGKAPTVAEGLPVTVEGHALNQAWENDFLYDKECRFYFHKRIRDEKKFESLDTLKQQIETDCDTALAQLKCLL